MAGNSNRCVRIVRVARVETEAGFFSSHQEFCFIDIFDFWSTCQPVIAYTGLRTVFAPQKSWPAKRERLLAPAAEFHKYIGAVRNKRQGYGTGHICIQWRIIFKRPGDIRLNEYRCLTRQSKDGKVPKIWGRRRSNHMTSPLFIGQDTSPSLADYYNLGRTDIGARHEIMMTCQV